jgi:hypothetical protein
MKPGKKVAMVLGIALVMVMALLVVSGLPIIAKMNADLKAYETRIAYRDNYKLHTTPLTKSVVEEICSQLGIKESSDHCQPNAVVYAPDLFEDIKTYFGNLPDQDKTHALVQNKLETYLDSCEDPAPDGHYRCRYDLRGDKKYPIFFYFNKDGFYYRIIANTGGS